MSNKNHDKEFLSDPGLKKLPFKVEDGYFSELTEKIVNAAEASESDLNFNLHLKKSPFKAPEGYFETLESKIHDRLNEEPAEEKTISLFRQTWVRWSAVAASIAIILAFYLGNPIGAETVSDELAVSDEAIIEYLDDSYGFSDELLASVEELESVLDGIYEEEAGIYMDFIGNDLELEYDFEYLEY